MEINQLSSQSVASNQTDTDKSRLEDNMRDNLEKNIDYQIINKLMLNQDQDKTDKSKKEKQSTLSSNHEDQLTLSAEAQKIPQQENTSQITQRVTQLAEQRTLTIEGTSEPKQSDPIVLDLNGDGITTTGIAKGVNFDINADGVMDKTSFVNNDNAFLAYDKNGNGVIDNGSELFGDQNGSANGYEELQKYDDNQDGKIDKKDAIYSRLQLLSLDKNNQQQLSSLSEHQIESISTQYNNTQTAINQYDDIAQLSEYKRKDGSIAKTADVLLGYKSYS